MEVVISIVSMAATLIGCFSAVFKMQKTLGKDREAAYAQYQKGLDELVKRHEEYLDELTASIKAMNDDNNTFLKAQQEFTANINASIEKRLTSLETKVDMIIANLNKPQIHIQSTELKKKSK
jgi:Na+/phosphate symporter